MERQQGIDALDVSRASTAIERSDKRPRGGEGRAADPARTVLALVAVCVFTSGRMACAARPLSTAQRARSRRGSRRSSRAPHGAAARA